MSSHRKNKNSQEDTRKRERSRDKEIGKKSDVVLKRDDMKKEEEALANNNLFKISIVSAFKVLMENFVEKELDKM
jgi:hypothetical protein